MQKNRYRDVSMVSAVAVLLLLAVYMVMTYRSVTKDIAERAGAQLTWALQLTDSGAELSLDTLAMRVDSLLGVAGLNRDVTLQELEGTMDNGQWIMDKVVRENNGRSSVADDEAGEDRRETRGQTGTE